MQFINLNNPTFFMKVLKLCTTWELNRTSYHSRGQALQSIQTGDWFPTFQGDWTLGPRSCQWPHQYTLFLQNELEHIQQ